MPLNKETNQTNQDYAPLKTKFITDTLIHLRRDQCNSFEHLLKIKEQTDYITVIGYFGRIDKATQLVRHDARNTPKLYNFESMFS